MARLVRRDAQAPFKVEVEGAAEPVWICACGLSANQPYCDGSHKTTRHEQEGTLYIYEQDDDEKACRTVTQVLTQE